jgi:signal transduction histidine kinase
MSLLQQLVQFLSQPPESLVYHLVTLLALQATFWLALWQLRRMPADGFARRLVWSSGGIIIGRLIILFASLSVADPIEAASILPPLERATDTATVVLLVWALAPQFRNLPRLGNIIALILLILTGFMYAFFAQEWIAMIGAGAPLGSYSTTNQADFWEIVQLVIIGIGISLIILGREDQWPLRLAVLSILLGAHVLSLFFLSSDPAITTDIAYWVRLGNLIAFPTLAILTYRHNLTTLLPSPGFGRSNLEDLAHLFDLARNAIGESDAETTIEQSLKVACATIESEYLAMAFPSPDIPEHYRLVSCQKKATGENSEDDWEFDHNHSFELSAFPSFKQALERRQQVELYPDGQGARQLHEFFKEIDKRDLGSMLAEPLYVKRDDVGLLLLAGPAGRAHWPAPEKNLATSLAGFLAQAINNTQGYETKDHLDVDDVGKEVGEVEMIKDPNERIRELEEQLAAESHRVERLVAALALAEELNRDDRVKKLEEDVDALREALVEAEDAMALAAANDAGVSTDWVMRTVSRYSGELEEAQLQISRMEVQISELSQRGNIGSIAALTSELRTPLTSLGVYTDLLMSESLGILGTQQMSVLKRMKTSIANMSSLLDEIINQTKRMPTHLAKPDMVDVRETIEAAIGTVSGQMQAKSLKLDLIIDEDLPAIPSPDDSFYQIVAHLLSSACLLSIQDGRVSITAQHDIYTTTGPSGEEQKNFYLHLAVSDSGAEKGNKLHARMFSSQSFEEEEPVDDYIVKARNDLSTVMELVDGFGGRTWVEYETGIGSKVSILLPINVNGSGEAN